MRNIATAIFLVGALAASACAQLPSGNIFFGYSYEHANIAAPALLPDVGGVVASGSTGMNGWNASGELKFLPLMGIVADLSAHYATPTVTDECSNIFPCLTVREPMDTTVYHYLFGPQISFSVGKVRPFAHALFGAGHLSESTKAVPFSTTETSFAYALGGGLDYKLFGPLRWRAQADFLQDNFFSKGQSNFRFSTGPVLHF